MSSLLERLRKQQCEENTGCHTQKVCVCVTMDEAADRIEDLESALLESMEWNWLDDDAPERFDLANLPKANEKQNNEVK